MSPADCFGAELLAEWVEDAAARSLALTSDLSNEHLMGPQLEIVNPLLWEIGHVAWFYEKWILRHLAGRDPIRPEVDSLYDSAAIPHDVRWDLPLLSQEVVLAYINDVRRNVLDQLAHTSLTDQLAYFVLLSIFHEDMHTEAYTYTRQTLCYPAPCFEGSSSNLSNEYQDCCMKTGAATITGDVEISGGTFLLGADEEQPFVFDNEKWAYPVEVKRFAISRTAVTRQEFAGFVEDDGYPRREFWCDDGWEWRESVQATHPVYWCREQDGHWQHRVFDQWISLEPHRPVLHVNWYEAKAYCRWAKRRLPTEVEWEMAASSSYDSGSRTLLPEKRRFPWGHEPPNPPKANLDWRNMGTVDVLECSEGDSACGCRQMIGNVWEWTADDFLPYPGFVLDPYQEYSQPWFGDHKVLRGGCWVTRSRLVRNTYRNFYKPHRRDVWAGFRTCALE